jgi:hypothetical protein
VTYGSSGKSGSDDGSDVGLVVDEEVVVVVVVVVVVPLVVVVDDGHATHELGPEIGARETQQLVCEQKWLQTVGGTY